MNKEEFLEYVASFDPKYASGLGKDLIKQAKKIKEDEETKDSSN